MSNMAKLSNRAVKAPDVLASGGRFDYGLEPNRRTGREQLHHRLRRIGGQVVTGISGATFRELDTAGFLQSQWDRASAAAPATCCDGRGKQHDQQPQARPRQATRCCLGDNSRRSGAARFPH